MQFCLFLQFFMKLLCISFLRFKFYFIGQREFLSLFTLNLFVDNILKLYFYSSKFLILSNFHEICTFHHLNFLTPLTALLSNISSLLSGNANENPTKPITSTSINKSQVFAIFFSPRVGYFSLLRIDKKYFLSNVLLEGDSNEK